MQQPTSRTLLTLRLRIFLAIALTILASSLLWVARANVDLLYFRATAQENGILIEWETATELQTIGFIVHRAESEGGPYQEVHQARPEGDGVTGAKYTWVDDDVTPGVLYYYKLEDKESADTGTFYGPAAAGIGVAETPTPTLTPTEALQPTDTPTLVPTATFTTVPTSTPTEVPTNTPTGVPTDTPTEVPTNTSTPVPTNTPTFTPGPSPTPSPTGTPGPSPTPTFTFTPTFTPVSSPTPAPPTPTPPQATATAETPPVATDTVPPPSPTYTPSPLPAQTATPTPIPPPATTELQPTTQANNLVAFPTPTPQADSSGSDLQNILLGIGMIALVGAGALGFYAWRMYKQ